MSTPSLSTYKVKPRAAARLIRDILEAGLVPYVSSSPGVGKSTIIKGIGDMLELHNIDHRLSTSEPTDMSGLPNFDKNGYAYFAPFTQIFPVVGTPLPVRRLYDASGNVVGEKQLRGWNLFLDELPAAPRNVQAAAFKVILDRMVGQHYLHPNVVITAAGNLLSDRSVVNPLVTAMQSRLVHLEMEVCFKEWLQDVAFSGNFDKRIVGFIGQFGNSKLMDFRPDHQDKTFACPRTWEFLNRLLVNYARRNITLTDEHLPAIAGTIGAGVGLEFLQYAQVWSRLVTVNQILADPAQCPIPAEADIKWATVSMIMQHVDPQNFKDFSTYVDRFDMAFRILFYRLILLRKPEFRTIPAFGPAVALISKDLNPW